MANFYHSTLARPSLPTSIVLTKGSFRLLERIHSHAMSETDHKILRAVFPLSVHRGSRLNGHTELYRTFGPHIL